MKTPPHAGASRFEPSIIRELPLTESGLGGSRRTIARGRLVPVALMLLTTAIALSTPGFAQTAGTGALAGTVTDPSGAVMPQVQIAVKSEATGEVRTVMSQQNGDYVVPLLLPGTYTVQASKTGFKVSVLTGIQVNVTETATLNIRLGVGTEKQSVTVQGETQQLETESSALGAVVGERTVSELPLVTRNYTQIVDLYSGVSSEVNKADDLGRGTTGPSNRPLVVHGVNSTDNNFQMNGVEINDFYQGSSADISGGVAIPNPDTIAEFKVQTGQYDAAYGRDAGANVDVVTKGGTNQLHGTAFEYFRNEDLDANDYFRNLTGQPRAPLRQNQFGFTLGGPIKKDKLLWFTSYQGTKQFNGVASGCASAVSSPPLTNDRSRATLGALFAGQRGFFQKLFGGVGPAILPDGSNIDPVALNLLQAKLPNGQYVIPTPQTVDLDPTIPFDSQGFSTFAVPCTFNEQQWMINADYLHTDKSKFSARFFKAGSDQDTTLPGSISPPGSPTKVDQGFWNASLSHTYTFSSNLFNQAEIAYHRTADSYDTVSPVSFSGVGATVPAFDDAYPVYFLPGTELGNIEPGQTIIQNTFIFQDSLAYVRGRHTLRFGGGITRVQSGSVGFHLFGFEYYLSWADLLLGLSGPANGTGIFSNVYGSEDLPALGDRAYRVWEGNTFVQDDFRATPRLTLNLGLRYERKGDIADALGRNSNIYINSLNPNPPLGGTAQGYVLPSNYSGAVPPPSGVTKLGNEFGINGDGQNTFGPRIGFAWQLPNNDRVVLRGGYGIYYSRIAGLAPSQGVVDPPFGILRSMFGTSNAAATNQNPLPPAPTLPDFVPYSPTTGLTPIAVSATMRPPVVQQYSLNMQTDLSRDFLLQVGYAGTRGTKLIWERGFNEASLASSSNPIRGQTTNTVANIPLRVPYEGFASELARNLESAGESWYNALEASVSKRFSHGLQFLASYTFGRTLTNAPDNLTGAVGVGEMYGDLNNPRSRYGPDSFTRDQRFIVSYDYQLPGPKNRNSLLGETLGGWSVAGVTTIQTGQRLSIYYTNGPNVYGITSNYAQLASGCTPGQVATSGPIQHRLKNYINTSCVGTPPVVGDDGKATAFGDTRPGILRGPDQNNSDIALVKRTAIERVNLEFRTEFFNAFNHTQFANPNTTGPSPTLGWVTQTAVAARIIQFGLKLNF
jgi:carboxypeptidase family protein/TonB-dependent receptor-like protein